MAIFSFEECIEFAFRDRNIFIKNVKYMVHVQIKLLNGYNRMNLWKGRILKYTDVR